MVSKFLSALEKPAGNKKRKNKKTKVLITLSQRREESLERLKVLMK